MPSSPCHHNIEKCQYFSLNAIAWLQHRSRVFYSRKNIAKCRTNFAIFCPIFRQIVATFRAILINILTILTKTPDPIYVSCFPNTSSCCIHCGHHHWNVSQTMGEIVTSNFVQNSSKSELSSSICGHFKVYFFLFGPKLNGEAKIIQNCHYMYVVCAACCRRHRAPAA